MIVILKFVYLYNFLISFSERFIDYTNCSINFIVRRRFKVENVMIFNFRETITDSSKTKVILINEKFFFDRFIKDMKKNDFQIRLENDELKNEKIQKTIVTFKFFE